MFRYILLSVSALVLGILLGIFLFFRTPVRLPMLVPVNQTIGFLPYWLLQRAQNDYSKYISTISYFGLTVADDGTIVKLSNPQEKEPGWYALESGKAEPFLKSAKKNNQVLSLVAFNADNDSINVLMEDPIRHADNLVKDIVPIMKQYGFSDLNLDIEYSKEATDGARMRFTEFTKEIKKGLKKNKAGTLSIDVSPSAFIKKYLVDPLEVSKIVDSLIIMGYDYHYQGSFVTGPVAPLFGGGSVSEFDVQTAIQKALGIMPSNKIILGAPLYGYEWETIDSNPRSPVIPGTGLVISSQRASEFLESCSTCSATFDEIDQEKHIIYKDTITNSYHQIFYPDLEVMEAKIRFAQKYNLGGIALWALGYEDKTILNPLEAY